MLFAAPPMKSVLGSFVPMNSPPRFAGTFKGEPRSANE